MNTFASEAVASLNRIKVASASTKFDTLGFVRQVNILLSAGMNVVQAVGAIEQEWMDRVSPQAVRNVQRINASIAGGLTLSEAVGQVVPTAPRLMIACMRAGERTGDLQNTLARYVQYAERIAALRKQLTGALIYPSIVMAIGALVIAYVTVFLMPKFAGVYENLNADLPTGSVWLFKGGQFISQAPLETFLILAGLALLVRAIWQSTALRNRIMSVVQSHSRVARYWQPYELSKFYRTLAVLTQSGEPLLRSLPMAQGVLSVANEGRVNDVLNAIRVGGSPSQALHLAGLDTPASHGLLVVAEKGGDLATTFENVANYYDDSVQTAFTRFSRIFEPVAMLAVAGMVGLVVLMMYMPIFELMGTVQ